MNGSATHTTDNTARRGPSGRATRVVRAVGTSQRAAAPRPTRRSVISPGSNASRPIAIKRNDDPQISEIEMNSVQSRAAKASRFTPSDVERTLRGCGEGDTDKRTLSRVESLQVVEGSNPPKAAWTRRLPRVPERQCRTSGWERTVSLAHKMNMKPPVSVTIIDQPEGVDLEFGSGITTVTDPATADAVVVFLPNREALERRRSLVAEAAGTDRLTWVAYPKAGQLATDLNRDILWDLLATSGIKPVRQVSIDDVWSAVRWRPG